MAIAPVAAEGVGTSRVAATEDAPPPAPVKKSKKSRRARGPRLERTGSDYATEDGSSDGSSPPRRIDKTIETLQAYVPGADVRLDAEQVEAQRQYLLEEAKKVKMQ